MAGAWYGTIKTVRRLSHVYECESLDQAPYIDISAILHYETDSIRSIVLNKIKFRQANKGQRTYVKISESLQPIGRGDVLQGQILSLVHATKFTDTNI